MAAMAVKNKFNKGPGVPTVRRSRGKLVSDKGGHTRQVRSVATKGNIRQRKSTPKYHGSNNRTFKPMHKTGMWGFERTDDNFIRVNSTAINKRGWYKASKAKERHLLSSFENSRTRRSEIANTLVRYRKRIDKIDTIAAKRKYSNDPTKLRFLAEKERLLASSNKLYEEAKVLRKVTPKDVKRQITALRAARNGKVAGLVALKGATMAGATIMKGAAIYNVASLMFDAINMIASPISKAGVEAVDSAFNKFASFARPELGGTLNMGFVSYGAATERQRAIQAISKSRINGRSMMGQEAQYMHN